MFERFLTHTIAISLYMSCADLIKHNIQVIIVLVQFHSYSGSEYMLYPIAKTAMIFEHVATN